MPLTHRLACPLLALTLGACLTGTLDPGAGPRVLIVTPDTLRLVVGTSTRLAVRVTDAAGMPLPDARFAFLSTDLTVASVTPQGQVTAEGPGRATIIVESAGSATAVPVEAGLTFADVRAGALHTCAVTPGSVLYCWGANTSGQLGVGDRANRLVPARVPGTWVAVAAGTEHTCALAPDGTAACWGGASWGPTPTPVAGGRRFRQIAAGDEHTCALALDSLAWCWGGNAAGQLGNGTFTGQPDPAPVAGALRFADLAAGAAHTCGVMPGGAAWCWGANDRGQLAVDTVLTLPQPVPRRAAAELAFQRVLPGGTGFTCALALDAGVWCWGRGLELQLGGGGTETARIVPGALTTLAGDTLRYARLAVGWAHACALAADGQLSCWGTSRLGQPGLHGAARPVPVLAGVAGVTAGFAHTCARLLAGALVCWGGGQFGTLGTGETASSDVPLPVALQLGDPGG